MEGVKIWFLQKNHCRSMYGKELETVRETAKAVLFGWDFDGSHFEQWVPKSLITDGWEKDTTNFGYRDYLLGVYHKAYDEGTIENVTIESGRNKYRGDAFIHQLTTKELVKELEIRNVPFMDRKSWNER